MTSSGHLLISSALTSVTSMLTFFCTDKDLLWSAVQSGWRLGLTSDEERLAEKLAPEAQTGRLVLFLGAGGSRTLAS